MGIFFMQHSLRIAKNVSFLNTCKLTEHISGGSLYRI